MDFNFSILINLTNLSKVEQFPGYYIFVILYCQSIIIPLSFTSALLTALVIPRRSVKVNNRSRQFYLIIAIADIIQVFFKDLQTGYLGDGLYFLTNGKIFIYFELLGSWACKFFRTTRFALDNFSNYTITVLCIERLIAIWFPLKSIIYLTNRNTKLIYCAILFPIQLYTIIVTSVVFDRVATPGTRLGMKCIAHPSSGKIGIYNAVIVQQINYTVHGLINITMNSLLIYSLFSILKFSNNIFHCTNAFKKYTSNAIRSSKFLLILSIGQFLIYLPCSITWPIFAYLAQKPRITEIDDLLYMHVANLAYTFILLTSLTRIWNFACFFLKIDSFRNEILLNLCWTKQCKYKRTDPYRSLWIKSPCVLNCN